MGALLKVATSLPYVIHWSICRVNHCTSKCIYLVSGNGLVGFWPMDSDSGLTDESGNGNDGTLGGNVPRTAGINAEENGAYQFRG